MSDREYSDRAESDAQEMFENFTDEMIEMAEVGVISDDLNNDYDGGDSYHHENHVDSAYDLTEAAAILDQLAKYEETDNGLWDGLQPREAISAQAAFTYGNAVYSIWQEKVQALNTAIESLDFEDDEDREDVVRRFIPAYLFLMNRDEDEFDGLTRGTFDNLLTGDFTGLLVLADRFAEEGVQHNASLLRIWATPKYIPEVDNDS